MAVSVEKTMALYKQVKDSEVFSGIKLEVFRYICHSQGLTVGEIYNRYSRNHPDKPERSRSELSKRVSELANLGIIKKSGKVICPYSNKMVTRWIVTGATPRIEMSEDGRKRLLNVKTPAVKETVEPTIVIKEVTFTDSISKNSQDSLRGLRDELYKKLNNWTWKFRSQSSKDALARKIIAINEVLGKIITTQEENV